MSLSYLALSSFRNIQSAELNFSPTTNVIYGSNGAGKTSLLEAMYYLGLGKSFRTSKYHCILQRQTPSFRVIAQTESHNQPSTILGIERFLDGSRKLRINGQSTQALSEIAEHLPLQLLSDFSHRYFHDGSKVRRQFMDWGVFYHNPSYQRVWQSFQRTIHQKNAGLKARAPKSEIAVWNDSLIDLCEQIDKWRAHYVNQLNGLFPCFLEQLLPGEQLLLNYSRGWSSEEALIDLLKQNYYRELQAGFSLYGAHRADLQAYKDETPVKDYLSQGQQKLVAYALKLAQGALMQQETVRKPIFLIDDLPSELDPQKRLLLFSLITSLNTQVILTGIEKNELQTLVGDRHVQFFKIDQGNITPEQ